MTPAWIGAAVGFLIGLADFAIFMMASRRAVRHGSAGVVRVVAVASLIAFPIVGWFLGPIVAENFAELS